MRPVALGAGFRFSALLLAVMTLITVIALLCPPAAHAGRVARGPHRRDGLQPPVVRDPLEGALCKAHEIADPFHKARVLTMMAAKFSSAQQRRSARDLLRHARETALVVPIPHDQAWALANIAYEYVKAGENTRGLVLFARAHKIALHSGDKRSHDTLFTEMSLLCAKANLFEQALRIAASIDDFWSRSVATSRIGVGLVHAGQFDKALEIMTQLVGQPNRSFVKADLAVAFGRAGRVKQALELASHLEDTLRRSQTVASIAEAQLEEGRRDEALAIVKGMEEKKNPHAALYKCGMLIRISADFEHSGEFGRAYKVLGDARKVARMVKSRRGRARSMAGIGVSHWEANQQLRSAWILDEGLRIASFLAHPAERVEALTWICRRLIRAGMKDEATSLLAHCHRQASALPNMHNERDRAVADVCRLYLDFERWHDALKLIRTIARPHERVPMLVEYNKRAQMVKRWDIAFEAARILRGKEAAHAPKPLLDIASLYVQNDRYIDALRVLRMIDAADMRAIGLAELAARYERLERRPTDAEMLHIRHIAKRMIMVVRPGCNQYKMHLRPTFVRHVIQRPDEDVRNAATWRTQP